MALTTATALARSLKDVGLDIAGDAASGFTETHQVIIQVGYARGPEIAQRLAARRLSLELSEEAEALIAETAYDPVYGARPLKRAVERLVLLPVWINAVARIVSDPPSSTFRAAPKKRFGRCNALASMPPDSTLPDGGCTVL